MLQQDLPGIGEVFVFDIQAARRDNKGMEARFNRYLSRREGSQ